MAAARGVRGLSRENEAAILAWIRRQGRRARARIVAPVVDALDDWMVA